MMSSTDATDSLRPRYDYARCMLATRAPRAKTFARQILGTVTPFLLRPVSQLSVLDVGSGYGHTAIELARFCDHVVGIEPNPVLFQYAATMQATRGLTNVTFRHQRIESLDDQCAYDLVVLDNVLEHIAEQPLALARISQALRPGGVAILIIPNKLWPIEVHYRLPFLSYFPLRLANAYLRMTGRGSDYTDSSYALTFWQLNRLLSGVPTLRYQYVLPYDSRLTMMGNRCHYRIGIAMLRRCPWLWPFAKVFLVLAIKDSAAF
jgi:2-polyprenyl-3-methyl-5-hydroxy-6-metoxy-1,4-benzoquinol methylase